MAPTSGDRSAHFPSIEKKHGGPISKWITRLEKLDDTKYADQVAFLRETHGFSQAHANALVMYVRGSTTSKKFSGPDDYFATLDPGPRKTARAIFDVLTKKWPRLDFVTAWNQPMLRRDKTPVFGLSVAKHHILLNFFSGDVIAANMKRLDGLEVNKKTIKVPLDWTVDATLLRTLTKARLDEIS